MYLMARIYGTEGQAKATANALAEAGYDKKHIAVLTAPGGAPVAPTYGAGGETSAPVSSEADATANALRVGSMLGKYADVYLDRMEAGNSLVVAQVPFMRTGAAETIFEARDPLPVNHEDPGTPGRLPGEADTPLSNWLGLATLSSGGPIMTGKLQDGTTHLSRWFPALASGWTLSSTIGISTKSKRDTPLSSMLGLPTKSRRLEGKSSSFGIPLLSSRATPLSSMLGLRVLSMRKRYLYETYHYFG